MVLTEDRINQLIYYYNQFSKEFNRGVTDKIYSSSENNVRCLTLKFIIDSYEIECYSCPCCFKIFNHDDIKRHLTSLNNEKIEAIFFYNEKIKEIEFNQSLYVELLAFKMDISNGEFRLEKKKLDNIYNIKKVINYYVDKISTTQKYKKAYEKINKIKNKI